MVSLYSFSILFLRLAYRIAATFHPKAKLFIEGRKGIFQKLQSSFSSSHRVIWVHCASLGEFEQGRPIMELIKKQFPSHKILLTFFSPSGYEVRNNYSGADWVYYLPWDTARNAKRFVDIVNPQLAIFIKYEFWYHYTEALARKSVPIISASSIFRPDQVFFTWYGWLFRKMLSRFNHFFVQSNQSAALLKSIGIKNITVAGDTRFDRVYAITQQAAKIEIAEQFKNNGQLMVIGSLWPEDLQMLAPFINDNKNALKFIIAPHEISEDFLLEIERSIDARTKRYSRATGDISSYSVLIIDNVGMLSSLYRYGEYAYVGGAYGKGLHNILEAACYGVPVFFGNRNYEKFQEARELIMRGGAFALSGYAELKSTYELMQNKPESFLLACEVTKAYVQENLGASEKILSFCKPILEQ